VLLEFGYDVKQQTIFNYREIIEQLDSMPEFEVDVVGDIKEKESWNL
jgi:hypothetical protein